MTRAASRVKHDEVVRMVKAVRQCGLPISEVVYENGKVRLVIGGDSGEKVPPLVDEAADSDGLIREPQP
jgi:hypothetical protein